MSEWLQPLTQNYPSPLRHFVWFVKLFFTVSFNHWVWVCVRHQNCHVTMNGDCSWGLSHIRCKRTFPHQMYEGCLSVPKKLCWIMMEDRLPVLSDPSSTRTYEGCLRSRSLWSSTPVWFGLTNFFSWSRPSSALRGLEVCDVHCFFASFAVRL